VAYIKRRVHRSGKVTYAVRFRDPAGRWVERTAGPRRRDAEAMLSRVLQEVASGAYGRQREDPRFSEFAERFLATKAGQVKASTLEDYAQVIRNHLVPVLGKLHLSQITPARVQDLLIALQGKGTSPATTGKVYRVLKVILRHAIALDLIDRDPTVGIRPPRVERQEMDYLQPEELTALLAATEGDLHDIIAVAALAGLRQGEILGLKWGDVDFEARMIKVLRSYYQGHGFSDLKTSSSRRAVPMPETLATVLEERWRSQGRPGPEVLVFPSSTGRPLDRSNLITREFEPALERAGLRKVRFHDLRHTYASLMIAAGMDPKALQAAMGHSSIVVTMDTYGHLFPGAHERAFRRLEAMLSPSSKVIPLPGKGGKGGKS